MSTIASKSWATAKKLITMIKKHATTESQGLGTEMPYGVSNQYNGVNIHQTRDYIKISCETYLVARVLQTHSWEKPSLKESDHHDSVPMSAKVSKKLCALSGPAEGTHEHATLAQKTRFSYCQVLSELIYAYIVCHLDIRYAITFFSHFDTAPAEEHYKALKDIAKYLCRTINRGIIYWHTKPLASLPYVPLPQPDIDPSLPPFPKIDLHQLVGYLNVAHATDLETQRSVTGYALCYASGAVAFKSKLQTTIATSSTEAAFVASVSAAKVAKYL
jgi:hypothetical protein